MGLETEEIYSSFEASGSYLVAVRSFRTATNSVPIPEEVSEERLLSFAGVVYSRQVGGKELTFGVSGLLYNANVLMYDRQSESLWSQVRREAVTGPMTGAKLNVLPSTITSWEKWRKRYPDTEVLSPDTGYVRDYSRDPYADYYESRKGFLSLFKPGPGEEEKALVAGVALEGASKAYPLELLRKKKTLTDTLAGRKLTLTFGPSTDQLSIRDAAGNEIPFITTYWFVWKGMYPGTGLYGKKP